MLSVKNLKVGFQTHRGYVQAVRGVSFDIEEGQTVAIVGESGCGKSATSKALLQLLEKQGGTIEAGQALFEGKDLLTMSRKEIKKIRGQKIALIFQDPMTSLNPTMTIGKQVLEALPTKNKESVLALLQEVEIRDPRLCVNKYPHELSGGQRQRVLIAMALAGSPRLLIADEPTTALDAALQQDILSLMKKEQVNKNRSLLLVTHDLGSVASIADIVIVMYAGAIVESGPTKTLLREAQHPYTQGLIRSIPTLTTSASRLPTIEGTPPDLISPPLGCPFCARCPEALRLCALKMPPPTHLSEKHYVACWKREIET